MVCALRGRLKSEGKIHKGHKEFKYFFVLFVPLWFFPDSKIPITCKKFV
jgi:hypothetical protein